jgi:hypothetical protein
LRRIWYVNLPLSCRRALTPSCVSGVIARVGPNDLITCSRELLTHMSAVRSPYTRTPWFSLAVRPGPGEDHLFSEMDEDIHTRKRQQMAAGVSQRSLNTVCMRF